MSTKRVFFSGLTRRALPPVIAVVAATILSHLPRDRAAARQEVLNQYRTAQSGYREGMGCGRDFERLEAGYGRVVTYRIEGERFNAWPARFTFIVRVERERASTRERVIAAAGNTRDYGRYARLDSVDIETDRQPRKD